MLPDSATDMAGSQGYFKFRIPLSEGLPNMTEVENTAAIYFDLNPPVITNTTNLLLVDCGLWSPSITAGADTLFATEGVVYQWYLNGEAITGATQGYHVIQQNGAYSVSVTSIHGCVNVSGEHIIVSTGGSIGKPQVSIFPNPFGDRITLVHDLVLEEDHSIQLVDMVGRTLNAVKGNGTNRLEINTIGLANGVYMLQHTYLGQTKGSWRIIKN